MTSDHFKPCPYYGCTEQTVKHSKRWGWFVSCRCGAVGPSAGNEQCAIAAWNMRNEPKQARLEL